MADTSSSTSALLCSAVVTIRAQQAQVLDVPGGKIRVVTVATGLVRCEGRVLSAGSRTALAEARLFDRDGKLCAHATSSCMVFRPK